ncbi:MAG: glycosyltransferase [Armatimonadota bacterium]|nr:glycosyltransferase [Armatimonadota bacterium]
MSASRDRRITVLHVIEGLGTGGSELQLTAFLLRSDASRFRHEVATFTPAGRCAEELVRAGIPVHTIGSASGAGMLRVAARLWRLARRIDADVVHASLFWPSVMSRVVGWLARKPVVTTLVNTPYEPEWLLDNPRLHPGKVRAAQWLDRLTASLGQPRFVAVTEAVRESTVRQLGCPRERIEVIPRGLVFNGARSASGGDRTAARAALGWQDAYPVLLNVGRLVPQKGQQYAVRAMPAVLARLPTARLVVVGEGWLRGRLERLIRELELEAHVSLLGERRDVPTLLGAADIFVFPSLFEGAANSLVEAMAAGRPCVASAIPSIAEITDNGRVALLVPLRDPDAIAACVVRLAADRDLAARLAAEARAWALARYDIRRSVAAIEALYGQVAGGRT